MTAPGGEPDPDPDEVRPGQPASDLRGRRPVRIRDEDGSLAAYGFAGQRVVIPAAGIGSLLVHGAYRGQAWNHGPALLVLDRDGRTLLRAPGRWDPADLRPLSAGLGVAAPRYLDPGETGRRRRPGRKRAPGYRRLRVRPRRFALEVIALIVAVAAAIGLGGFGGAQAGVALPPAAGTVRSLVGVAGALAGASAALWLLGQAVRAGQGALRWLAISLDARSPAPAAPFFQRRQPAGGAARLATAALAVAVAAAIGWGPVVGIVTLVHGFADQALVSHLRQVGSRAPGRVVDLPTATTDFNGNPEIIDRPALAYHAIGGRPVLTPDPAIGGRTWPVNPGRVLTVVYDPAEVDTAAVAGQLDGSPWHGAPTANLIAAALLTVALPLLTWRLVRRLRARRRGTREDVLDDIR